MALLVVRNGCRGEKFEYLVAKICHFLISDIIKTGLLPAWRDVIRETKLDDSEHGQC